MPETYADLSSGAVAALKSARTAGPRMIVPPQVDDGAIEALLRHGLARFFMGHAVLTAAGRALRKAA